MPQGDKSSYTDQAKAYGLALRSGERLGTPTSEASLIWCAAATTSNTMKGENMKSNRILITAFSVAAFAVGCKPTDRQPPANDPPTPQLDQVRKESKEALQATKAYAYAQKAEFVESMKVELAALDREVDMLAAKVEKSSAATKEEANVKLQAIRTRTAELNKELDGVKDATESTWEDVKAGFKKGYDEAKDAFNQARKWLSEKIEPSSGQ